jgi:Amt family ammonium transporter
LLPAAVAALIASLVVPAVAGAAALPSLAETQSAVNTTWVIVAAVLVMFMQAGFAFLEIGFSRMKNAGSGIAKILINFSVASVGYWAVGFALAFGGSGLIARSSGSSESAPRH